MAVDRRRDARGRVVSTPVVAFDTNALMMPVEADVDPFVELERLLGAIDAVVLPAVLSELTRLSEGGTSMEARAARVGRRLAAEHCRTLPPRTDADGADAALVSLSTAKECDYVVTNDGPLRERLHALGMPVISLRGENTLAVIYP